MISDIFNGEDTFATALREVPFLSDASFHVPL